MYSAACRIIPPSAFTNSCLGIGGLRASLTPRERNRLTAQSDLLGAVAGCVPKWGAASWQTVRIKFDSVPDGRSQLRFPPGMVLAREYP